MDPLKIRKGRCVYEAEVVELMKRLNAEGIMLLVVKGNRNIDTYEVSSAVRGDHVKNIGQVLIRTGIGYIENALPFIDGSREI